MGSCPRLLAQSLRFSAVALLAASLAGCYTAGGGGSPTGGTTTTTTTTTPPAKFYAVNGQLNANAVRASGYTDVLFNNRTNMNVDTTGPGTFEANIYSSTDSPSGRRVTVSGSGFGYFTADNFTLESNGAAARGALVGGPDAWATYANSPGSRLDGSLGATSLEHSFAGVAFRKGGVRSGSSSDVSWSVAGLYGGRSTSDMPTSGRADYAGGFEGIENASTDATMRTSNISGKADVSADFGARTVRGRIDNVNNHSAGPLAQSAGYSIGFNGTMTGSSISGTSWLTQRNSDAPLPGFTQTSGTMQGGFFGPGAAEVAGGVSTLATNGNHKLMVTGGFGAKKK